MTPGPRFSATISASRIKRRAISFPSSLRRLTTVLRLLLLSSRKKKLSRFGLSAFHSRRARSPWGGRSILITSAPSQASIWVQDGPAWSCVKSMTRIPSRAWLILNPLSLLGGAADRAVDPVDQIGRQRAGLCGGNAFGELAAVFDAQHHRVDGQ